VLQTNGSVKRVQRAETVGLVKTITRQIARSILNQRLRTEGHNQRWPQAVQAFSDFVEQEWRPNATLAVQQPIAAPSKWSCERHEVCRSRALSPAVLKVTIQSGFGSLRSTNKCRTPE